MIEHFPLTWLRLFESRLSVIRCAVGTLPLHKGMSVFPDIVGVSDMEDLTPGCWPSTPLQQPHSSENHIYLRVEEI